MKQFNISAPDKICSTIDLPSSKSICNRALIINALSMNDKGLSNLSDCDDTKVIIEALHYMPKTIDIKAAGTAMRFMTSFLAVSHGSHIITGTERMKQRPIKILVDALRKLGAEIMYVEKEGYPPLAIEGKNLNGGRIELPGNVSSQFISSLLMIAPILKEGLTIELKGKIVSIPYINMTIKLMQTFGAIVSWISEREIQVLPHPYHPTPFRIGNDWSASSYWYEMAAFTDNAQICLPGLSDESLQGDSQISRIFHYLGVDTQFTPEGIVLCSTGRRVTHLTYNFINEPDLAQTLVVTCCILGVTFRFDGLQSLKIKETDRIEALKTELKKLGYVLTSSHDCILEWHGERCPSLQLPAIDTYEDHRMAMSFAPIAIKNNNIIINNPDVVSKSYPNFWNDLSKAGFTIKSI